MVLEIVLFREADDVRPTAPNLSRDRVRRVHRRFRHGAAHEPSRSKRGMFMALAMATILTS